MKRNLVVCGLAGLLLMACGSDKPLAPAQLTVAIPAVAISGHGNGVVGAIDLVDGVGPARSGASPDALWSTRSRGGPGAT